MNEKETSNTDGIECPYCGYIEDDCEAIYDIEEEELEKFDCPHCQKSMNVQQIILRHWEASTRTREWLEADIKRLQDCGTFYKHYENKIKKLKEEIKNL